MTENEKAATFIGWKPGKCTLPTTKCVKWVFVDEPGKYRWTHDHMIPAPDMSRPENYMRALVGLEYKHPWKIEWHIDAGCYEVTFFMPSDDGDGKFLRYRGIKDRSVHEAVRSALAALYDAERPSAD